MKVIGITGGVGAGKSTVLDFFEKDLCAYVIQADKVGHVLMEPGQVCYEPVLALFGKDVRKIDKTIDSRKISDIVFSRKDLLEKLNAIIHPAVKAYIREAIRQQEDQGTGFCVVEAALLLEDHYQEICDEIWYVHTDKEIRIQRLMESRGYSREKALGIIDSQASDAFFRANTDYTIENNGDLEDTRKQIREGIKRYETL